MIKDSLGSNYQLVGQFIYSLYLFPGKSRMLDPIDPKLSNKAMFETNYTHFLDQYLNLISSFAFIPLISPIKKYCF